MCDNLKSFESVEEVPIPLRKECRQLIALGLGLEICSIYCPEIIAPNIEMLY
jgi:hypothetical protein